MVSSGIAASLAEHGGEVAQPFPGGRLPAVEHGPLAAPLVAVLLAEVAAGGLVVPLDRLERLVGDAPRRSAGSRRAGCCRSRMWCVEERQRLARLQRLHPEADLAQLDGHRVDVDAVEARRRSRRAVPCGLRPGRAPRRRCGPRPAAGRSGGRPRPGSARFRRPGRRPSSRGSPPPGRACGPPRRAPGRVPSRAARRSGSSACSSCRSSSARCRRPSPGRTCRRRRQFAGAAPAATRRRSPAPRTRGFGSRPAAAT